MAKQDWSAACRDVAGGVQLRVKVTPGASRSRLSGLLGDRVKLAVQAPPEAGKANDAVCRLLARLLGVAAREVVVVAGATQPRKTIEVRGLSSREVLDRLARQA